jgi:subtilisin family serine protease
MSVVFLSQQDTRTRPDLPKLDLHVLPLYKMGVTGRGVTVVVLDDGIEYTHDDIRENYVSFCYSVLHSKRQIDKLKRPQKPYI